MELCFLSNMKNGKDVAPNTKMDLLNISPTTIWRIFSKECLGKKS
jgi:hypothetical protein